MLRVHRAERADRLVDALAEVLADPLDDPFATELISVHSKGVERWLTQRLSATLGAAAGRSDGVCANVEFPFPGKLVIDAVARAAEVDPETDRWVAARSVWPLLEVVEAAMDDAWLAPLAGHLGRAPGHDGDDEGSRSARRLGTVRHLADLFDRYAVHRPAMVRRWAAGDDVDADGVALPEDRRWQAELWRRLRDRIGTPGPAERLEAACDRLRDNPDIVTLPPRLSLFGLTRLPASYLDVLDALAVGRAVELFLLHPSPVLWDRVAAQGTPASVPRRADARAVDATNPLLATWGQDAREMQLVVSAGRNPTVAHHPLEAPASTLLARLQADVRADRAPAGPPAPGAPDLRPPLALDDRSVQVHACHGRARQVEVLRDTLLHLLAEDPTLEPRDVIVMCPDIDSFAPLIHATFGAGQHSGTGERDDREDDGEDAPPGHDLRVRLADRSIRQTNPVLAVVAELLGLASGRITASQVLDLAGRDPVRRRFGFDDDALERLEHWVAATGIRWGLDAGHRAPYQLDKLDTGTWRAGLDRLLAGVAMDEDGNRLLGDVLPLDDVDSGDIATAGRLAELIDRLAAVVDDFATPKPVGAWATSIADAADALTATRDGDGWQRAQLGRLLDEVVAEAGGSEVAEASCDLTLTEITALLADRLRGRPTRANFRTGHLTMCTLVPMRSVPHRVVCLMGLDDGAFPRRVAPDGDDLIGDDPRAGDHDRRSEDRQLLLDALLSATDHVVITYAGRDERTNVARPPAVPVGELLDTVDATVRTDNPSVAARQRVVVHHPLQPFDPRNFEAGELVPERVWSFDGVALAGAQARLRGAAAAPSFLDGPLGRVTPDVVELEDLVRFVQHPVKAFLRQRLGISLSEDIDEPADALAVELDGLAEWSVGQRMLEARLAGADAAVARAAEQARGLVPPGALGTAVLDRVTPRVDAVAATVAALVPPGGARTSIEINVELGDGRALVGTVPDVAGDLALAVSYSRVGPKHRVAAWVRLLALTAAHPERAFRFVTVGRMSGGATQVAIGPLGRDEATRRATATERLRELLDLYDRGMCEPLPLCCQASEAWAAARGRNRDPEAMARKEWETTKPDWTKEDQQPEHRLAFGGAVPFDTLLEARPGDDERGDGWAADEPTRFGRLARRLWDPVLVAEQAGASR